MARCRYGAPYRILLDGGTDGSRLDSRCRTTVESRLDAGDSVSAGRTVAVGPSRDADDRGRGTPSGISRWLDVSAACEVHPAAQMAAARECGVRTSGGVDRPSIGGARLLRRQRGRTARHGQVVAHCCLERGRAQSCRARDGISGAKTPRTDFRVRNRALAELVAKSTAGFCQEGSRGTPQVPAWFLGRPRGQSFHGLALNPACVEPQHVVPFQPESADGGLGFPLADCRSQGTTC